MSIQGISAGQGQKKSSFKISADNVDKGVLPGTLLRVPRARRFVSF
jgi:hypothetical protein